MSAPQPSRVLVYRTGHLGDTVCAIPAFRLIRRTFPKAEITLLCDEPTNRKVSALEVIGQLNLFDRIRTYSSRNGVFTPLKLALEVRRARPQTILLLAQARETPPEVRRKQRFFRSCGVRDVRAAQVLHPPQDWQPNESERLLQLLAKMGVTGEKPDYEIAASPVRLESVRQKLVASGIDSSKPFLVFCGGGKASAQRWPLERYATVLKTVSEQLRLPILGLGTDEEVASYREKILPRFPRLILPVTPFTIPELFELHRLATAYFGNDTGPMHVAAAVNCPVAAVISARNPPGAWDPDVAARLIFRHRTYCENCFLEECTREGHRCLTAITETEVLAELLPFLKKLLPD
jgi:ADP-heptose:LPS heptosyltransferase